MEMEEYSDMKIWRYMDLAKFISLLITESLYFPCPSEFDDPFEGFLPRSHIEAYSKILNDVFGPIIELRNQLAKQFSGTIDLQQVDDKISSLSLLDASKKADKKFGISCWHKSEYESEAMWRLYSASGQGIAIESTIKRLKDSLGNIKGLIIDSVRYMDFDNDPIEKGHRHYGLFIKRKSFEHEKELRATLLLSEEGQGTFVKCNLDELITNVHISPLAPTYFKDVVVALCSGKIRSLGKPVIQSKLFNDPDYGIKTDIKT